jgi:hypothetical protein
LVVRRGFADHIWRYHNFSAVAKSSLRNKPGGKAINLAAAGFIAVHRCFIDYHLWASISCPMYLITVIVLPV